jgi:hypothetical protein
MKLLRWISRPCWALRLSLGRSLLRPIVKQHRDIFNDNPGPGSAGQYQGIWWLQEA